MVGDLSAGMYIQNVHVIMFIESEVYTYIIIIILCWKLLSNMSV